MKYILNLILTLSLAGCGNAPGELELEGLAQGTSYHIKFVPAENTDASAVHREIDALLAKIDLQLSNYRDDSEASRFNQQQGTDWVTVSPALPELVSIAKVVHGKSHGCYDLTVKPLLEAWGFFKHEERMPSDEEIIAAKNKVGLDKIEADSKGGRLRKKDGAMQIDFSSIGQGYSVGQVATLLESRGITNYLLEIGGEMKVRGKKADGSHWRVAIEKPVPGGRHELQRIIEVPTDRAMAIMTSGSYRNFFESGGKVYSHIVSPSTGKPVDHHLLSVSVLHDDPTWADAWSTALLCLGEKEGPQLAAAEGLKAFFIYGENGNLKEITSPALSQEHFVNLPK
ncbi:FAD:protein FMN transferase [Methylobacter sp. sgz302048]|uniref:FAD:protein FMN transferase n=1 Tax=Methylobacter sp. sgz302048 TaxID=3455945 RepID=UPI003FA0BA23